VSGLLEIQRDIAASLRDANMLSRAGRWLAGDPALVERRLAIYRANVAASAARALGAAYPVVRAAGTVVIASKFPIARIWTIHQSGYQGEFVVDWSVSERALVAREGLRVMVSAVGAGEAGFIASSLDGAALGAAVTAALKATRDFNLGTLLTWAIASNLISGFTIDKDE
jgi:hypothetical protein